MEASEFVKPCSSQSVIYRALPETLSLGTGVQNCFPNDTEYSLPFYCVDICPHDTKAIVDKTPGSVV